MPKKLKASNPTEAPEALGKIQGEKASAAKQRSEAGTGEEIEDVAVMSEGDLDGVPIEVETEAAEKKVSEGEEEDVVDGDPHVSQAKGDGTVVSGHSRPRTPTADDSWLTDGALRFALVTEILEGGPIRPRVINGVLIDEDILKLPLALAWDKWLWGSEFERRQSWEIQQIYGLIVHRTGREF